MSVHHGCRFALVLLCSALVGCGSAARTEVPAGELNMRNLAILLGQYTARHQGRGPKDEQEFRTFLKGLRSEELKHFGGDVDQLFISPRDSQPYVILYAQGSSPASMTMPMGPVGSKGGIPDPVAAYEQQGKDGKRYVAHQTGKVDLVDDAAFQELVKP